MSCEPLKSIGYCGKIPAKGDFIQQHLNQDFLKNWNDWLQAVLAVSKEQAANEWLDYYLTSPIWNFSLSAGICCEEAVIGTVIPSVDQVGRHYPFTVAGFHSQSALRGWCDNTCSPVFEQHILSVLEDDTAIDTWLIELLDNTLTVSMDKYSFSEVESEDQTKTAWVFTGSQSPELLSLLDQQYKRKFNRYSIWWTEGSADVEPCVIITEGLPQVSQFISMLNGQWKQTSWNMAELNKDEHTCT
ncbi:type VI secretion system-associated protein TagF [Shewanella sp. 1_MG-2023]|uniref:type VI secretion system-associated protein TagF n=1 Tax=unclassified Shewanella TaxID=196818 RepID=UPI000C85B67D|nr:MULTISPECIES: type VI secretion system-associated protein TagF [unclassified Shewanella]MDO6610158.1 type VI secretion system-associated protein TagF [Shewanella sp. 7_MG-2023]MDO6769700.1 type VI secretion system-associated protein TagF [Shewanella sp. 2_MG-2023]MDO6777180.1 type VI secretion system-associated protein TagF [Shewanella sp. 3_MG-2023]MDO6792764.1 type VI secretion system-associated protein TagF [Shewanella sp. 1_MG-2023]PMG75182.1 type VI secretion-associated protein [Shewan